MNREHKYRVWVPKGDSGRMHYFNINGVPPYLVPLPSKTLPEYPLMDFTGKQGVNKRDLYEGDIVFYEQAEEDGDHRYYLVIVWIPEWSMFASLHLREYHKYIENGIERGVETLDESMFWTYTLTEDADKFHYAGNIYENPELLQLKDASYDE